MNLSALRRGLFFRQTSRLGFMLLYSTAVLATDTDGFNDWVSDSSHVCGGYYSPPMPSTPPSAEKKTPSALRITADQSEMHLEGHSLLMGNVAIEQDDRRIEAAQARIEHEPHTRTIRSIDAYGNIKFIQPGLQVIGAHASADKNTGSMSVDGAEYHFYDRHARGHAENISIDQDRISTLLEADYTTCAPGSHAWELSAKKVVINPNTGRGKAWDAWLTVQDVPVLYAPFFNFPIDDRRMSGFLFPSFSESDKQGLFISIPYYFNLAPNYDAQIMPKYIEKRGPGLDATIRYLTHSSSGQIDIASVFHDKAYATFRHEKRRAHPTITDTSDPRLLGLSGLHRALLHVEHETQIDEQTNLKINYNRVSDDNYFTDLEPSLFGNSVTELEQSYRLGFTSDLWGGFLRFQEYQVLHPFEGAQRDEIYRRQPQLYASSSNLPTRFGANLDVNAEFTRFNIHKDRLTQTSQTHGDRWHIKPALFYPIETPGWFITPGAKLDVTYYSLARGTSDIQANKPNQPSRVIPIFDTKAGLSFERKTTIAQHPFLQTLEPQLYYLYAPYINQDPYPNFDTGPTEFSIDRLWRDNRFTGIDRFGDAHQISLGLTSRLMDMSAYYERARLTIGQIYYFKERQVTSCDQSSNPACRLLEDPTSDEPISPIISQLGLYVTPQWYTLGTVEYNTQIGDTERASLGVEYRGKNDAVFNMGLQYLRQDPSRTNLTTGSVFPLNQISSSLFIPISNRWRLLGRVFYDRAEHNLIDALAGVEYESCCFAVQLLAQRFLIAGGADIITQPRSQTGIDPYNNAISLQVTLKGLSTFGLHENDKKIKTLIPGYRPFDSRVNRA